MSRQGRVARGPHVARLAVALLLQEPGALAFLTAVTVLNGLRTGAYAFITAGLVDGLVTGRGALGWGLAFAGVFAVESVTGSLGGVAHDVLSQRLRLGVQERLLRLAAAVPLIRYSDPDFLDRLERASRELAGRLDGLVAGIAHLVRSVVQVVGLLGAVVAVGGTPWLMVLLVVASAWGFLADVRVSRIMLERSRVTAEPSRLARAWAGLLSDRTVAGEVRQYGAGPWILQQWAAARDRWYRNESAASARMAWWNAARAVGRVLVYGAMLYLVAGVAAAQPLGRVAGAFAALLQIILWAEGYFDEVVSAAGNVSEQSAFVADLGRLFTEEVAPGAGAEPAPGARSAVELRVQAFRYPGGSRGAAVREVRCSIAPGEIVAVVGPNGAGKTTLAMLALGLYDPQEGEVRVGGAEGGAGRGAAVLQEFARYRLTVRDNVGFGRLVHLRDDAVLARALSASGWRVPAGLDEWLSPEFGGRDLSGGEWLQLAMARAYVSDRGLMVLDEPTAALDPLREAEVFRQFVELCRGHTAVVISHRLGIARLADRIVVMDQGGVVETGTHESLLAHGGLYAEMWRAQAKWYETPGAHRGA